MTQLHDLTALEQAAAIKTGETSAVELTRHYLDRSADSSGAFVVLTENLALEQAAAADLAVLEGRAGLGPLFGVVCPVKDLFFMVGANARFGSVAYDFPSYDDDYVVQKMRSAGLVFTGKTNTPEFGLPCYTEPEPEVAPPARCVFDPERTAGGSSGGAAVAVAAGLAPIAHGSDGGGSVRIPAAANGLVGMKPSRGRISNGPLRDPVGDLVTSGPLARTVADAAALLDVMSGGFPGDPHFAPPPAAGSFLAAASRDPGPLRIGYFTTPIIAVTDVDPEMLAAVESTKTALADLGHDVVEVPPPFAPDTVRQFEFVWEVLALLTPMAPEQESSVQPLTRHLRERGRKVSGIDLAGAVSLLRVMTRAALMAWQNVDVVLCPTVSGPPPLVTEIVDRDDPAADFENQKKWAAFTAAFNITGQPSITVPVARTGDGLPLGVQLVGRVFDEETVIQLAAQLERELPWHHIKAPAW